MNQNPEAIAWPECMCVGISRIDEQHRILATIVYTAQTRLAEDSGHSEIEALIDDLISYVGYHFDTEEELMSIHDYHSTERENHCREHRHFSAAIIQFQQDIQQGKQVSRDELLGFIREWLALHILNTDMKLGEFLRNLEKTDF